MCFCLLLSFHKKLNVSVSNNRLSIEVARNHVLEGRYLD